MRLITRGTLLQALLVGVFRNQNGVVIAAFSKHLPRLCSVELAELLAIREGLYFAIQQQIPTTMVECDLLLPFSANAYFLLDVLSLLSSSRCGSCYFVSRSGNKVAHYLVKLALLAPSEVIIYGFLICLYLCLLL
ncbi:hypothetical protein TorRG33x02_195680 [Trema orientale]|uniref:RNase H type-1 domain-containing protein n=1 Tax=Trema orientale TaxID=63057 RepID=A0A2P5EGH8_TREOI|nr:hypothetical protein TorRG33x02_195680 [Trema orientale]